jgi:serine protease SohB
MEYIIEYGVFLAKAVTIVVSVIFILGVAFSNSNRREKGRKKGVIRVSYLNEHYETLSDSLKIAVLDRPTLKLLEKAEKKKAKDQERKNKKRAKTNAAASDSKVNKETMVAPKDNRKKRVFVLNFEGDVGAEAVSSLREEITTVLSLADESDEIVLRLESPGGMVHAYGLASSQLLRIRNAGIPLTICVDKVAASGGYMMACLADRLIAAPFAIIGSIGVLVQLPNFNRVLQNYDVDYEIISAGEYKRTLTTFGEITEKGREKVKEEVETIHDVFKKWVKEYRPAVEIDKIATGETWLGSQAKDRYMVDDIRTSDEILVEAVKEHDVYEVEYELPKSIQDKLAGAFHGAFNKISSSFNFPNKNTNFQ